MRHGALSPSTRRVADRIPHKAPALGIAACTNGWKVQAPFTASPTN
jgi:hypothetical protein